MPPRTTTTLPCPTRRHLLVPPPDLISWAQAAEAVARSPHPMSERNLRRLYIAAGRRVFTRPGLRGDRVSRSAVLEFHRDYWRARTAPR